MVKISNENQARYHVVTLLYNGKFNEAEAALTALGHNGMISRENEIFYRFLLQAAIRNPKSSGNASQNPKLALSERRI